MCNNCPYNHDCADCAYKPKRRYRKTDLDTSDMRVYKRDWARKKRAEERLLDMQLAGVAP